MKSLVKFFTPAKCIPLTSYSNETVNLKLRLALILKFKTLTDRILL